MIGLPILVSPLGRKIAAGILGLAIVSGGAWWLYARGKAEGKLLGAAEQLEQDKESFERERQRFTETLAAAQQREDHALELLRQAQETIDRANQRIAQVQAERASQRQAIESLPDAELFADITKKLGIRAPTDLTPSLYPAELRRADLVITDYPISQQENQALGEKLAGLEDKVGALELRVEALAKQRDAAIEWGNQVVGHFVRAYNTAQKVRKRPLILKILTFGLLRDPKLDLPEPVSLERLRPRRDE